MTDESSKLILADTAVSALEEAPRRRFFGRGRKGKKGLPPLTHCENCNAELAGQYCAKCGQLAIHYRRSFRQVFVDALESFLNWDSKFFATMALLMTRPWRLTNAFLSGQRVRYLHPLRLYLLVSILFFLGINQLAKSAKIQTPEGMKKVDLNAEEQAEVDQALKEMPALRNTPLFQMSTEFKREEEAKKNASPTPTPAPGTETSSVLKDLEEKPFFEVRTDPNEADSPFERWIEDRVKTKIGENGINAKVFLVALVNNLPAMMLCAIPFFAFVLKILYVRKGIFYIDHLVYALHIHTFAYIATMAIGFAGMGLKVAAPALKGWAIAILCTTVAVQIFLSIRRVYRQGWFMTIFKFCIGGWIYFVVLMVTLMATIFVTLALP